MAAVEGSLRRLQTSYIDLYQLHWPDRYAPGFGFHTYDHTKYRPDTTSFEETVRSARCSPDSVSSADLDNLGNIGYVTLRIIW
jgi:aryl-alcohol dehydrogenase-like predicted oxidoreductase